MTRKAFEILGGWEERIRGWGGEDDHMTIKIVKLIGYVYELDQSFAMHLHHEGGNLYGRQDLCEINPHYPQNLKRIAEIQNMSIEEIKKMCLDLLPQIGNINHQLQI